MQFFTDSGILSMLEAADNSNVDLVFSLFGQIVDTECGNSKSVAVMEMISMNVNVNDCPGKLSSYFRLTKEELQKLEGNIGSFWKVTLKLVESIIVYASECLSGMH